MTMTTLKRITDAEISAQAEKFANSVGYRKEDIMFHPTSWYQWEMGGEEGCSRLMAFHVRDQAARICERKNPSHSRTYIPQREPRRNTWGHVGNLMGFVCACMLVMVAVVMIFAPTDLGFGELAKVVFAGTLAAVGVWALRLLWPKGRK